LATPTPTPTPAAIILCDANVLSRLILPQGEGTSTAHIGNTNTNTSCIGRGNSDDYANSDAHIAGDSGGNYSQDLGGSNIAGGLGYGK